jgi:3-oxoacyl-[acyl-carrier protein] reductase
VELGLEGRTAIVTGASRGIGLATATQLATEGANVVLTARGEADLESALRDLNRDFPGQVRAEALDVSDQASIDRALANVTAEFGTIHVLINNAGPILQSAAVAGSTDEKWLRTFDVKAMGMLRMARSCSMLFPDDGTGRIVNVSGVSGRTILTNSSASGMANAAICALTSYLAQEFAPLGVNVNCVSPGLIKTEAWKQNAVKLGEPLGLTGPEYLHELQAKLLVASGRWAEPIEVANVIVFLCSDRASYITGQVIEVDGGLSKTVV